MPMSSHGSLHQFATLRLKTYILARKGRELLVACRPPRGLTPLWAARLPPLHLSYHLPTHAPPE